jgi:hypothetical protein
MSADTSIQALLARNPETRRPELVIVPHVATRIETCGCRSGSECCGQIVAGRTPAGLHCQAHLVDQLEIA